MTVQELILELEMFPEDAQVKIQTDWGQFSVSEVIDDEDMNGDIASIFVTRMTDDVNYP